MAATYQSKKPYTYGTGRRKSSVARVHLFANGTGKITINGRDLDDYFGLETLKVIVRQPLTLLGIDSKFDVECTVSGMTQSGTTPYLRTMLTAMSHWPPSCTPVERMKETVRSLVGRSAVSRMLSRK